ncbi:MAG: hypothetical protein HZY79_10945 [Rhodoblastus sp.]|nr:MAG: hypothetical protein HZY79_10945 [Rhodoblastus sp.]
MRRRADAQECLNVTRRRLLLSAASLAALSLAGCGGPPPRTFDLSALPGGAARATGGRGQRS